MESLESGTSLSFFDKRMPDGYDVGAGEVAGLRALWKTEVNDHPQMDCVAIGHSGQVPRGGARAGIQ